MAKDDTIGLGLIGCGGFGEFCLRAFSTMPEVRLVAVADTVQQAADSLGRKLGLDVHHNPAELVARRDVDLVHVATPPASHHNLVMAAIKADKHCLCEKPLAVNLNQADEMLRCAAERRTILPVNFVLRYNRVTEVVKLVIDSGILGKVLAARLTNCATDSKLGSDHWFWDKQVSGGIFVEHGVHFFDLYSYWFGRGHVVSAHVAPREGTGQADRVTCLVRHDSGALASHYHGFDQALPMDRTEHRIICEMGDIRISGWIPMAATVDAAVSEEHLQVLKNCAEGCHVTVTEEYPPSRREFTSRGKSRKIDKRVALTFEPETDKQAVYAESVRNLLSDQIAFVHDAEHTRKISEDNGRDSLVMALSAKALAEESVSL